MKIAQFNTHDSIGGAAKASYRLYLGMKNKHPITYYVHTQKLNDKHINKLDKKKHSLLEIEGKTQALYINNNRSPLSNTLFSITHNSSKLPELKEFDIINIHWIEYFLSLENLYELTLINKPIVWTLHDMKPFTGGCHYSNICTSYYNNCDNCIQLSADPFSLPQQILKLKKQILKNANLTIVTPSKWLKKEAKKSALFKNKKIKVIPNGIDSNIYKAWDKKEAKSFFNIEDDTIVISFGVANHNERRKGYKELLLALELIQKVLKQYKVKALFFGASSCEDFPIETINLGTINNEETLSKVYSAADFFVLPSLEDNLPNTILESLSCATPIVSFDTGGAKDIINPSCGLIVPKGDIRQLSDSILTLIKNSSLRKKMGKEGRKLILKKYQIKHQVKKYTALYEELQKRPFKYKYNPIDLISFNYTFSNFILQHYCENKSLNFSKQFNTLYEQLQSIDADSYSYLIYGYGTLGKTIHKTIPNKIVGLIDKNSQLISQDINLNQVYHPNNLKNMKFDRIIISVLGREDEIKKNLIQEYSISKDKIISFKL